MSKNETPAASATPAPLYFASGSNRTPEIAGLDRLGHAIGVAAPEVANKKAEAALFATKRSAIFIDSGAFSEADFPKNAPPVIVRPMTAAQWAAVLGLYLRAAKALGARVWLVAPDCVGDQAETLRRLARYAGAIRQCRELGANVIVPVQKGAMTQAAFDLECSRVLGFSDYVRGIPAKKKATTLEELAAFVAEARPARVHLLGMGLRNDNFADFAAAATAFGAVLTCDSNMIKGSAGKSNGRDNHAAEDGPNSANGQGPRVYTRAQQIAREIIAEGLTEITEARELGIVLAFAPVADEARRWEIIAGQLEARRAARVIAA